MRSISAKIALAFVVVSLLGVVLASFFIQQRTRVAFNRFLIDQDRDALVEAITQHYQQTGSWEGVEIAVRRVFLLRLEDSEDAEDNPERFWTERGFPPFYLVDVHGRVVFGRKPQPDNITRDETSRGIPIEVNGQTVGWLLEATFPNPRNAPERAFLESIRRDIIISAIGALVIALILGGLLARSLTRPLRELATATDKVAGGELGYQVDVHSQDEIGQLAASFNQMSTDLDRSNQTRKQMTADIAHDLRTPLSIILGYTEALREGKLQADEDIFGIMHQQAQHLNYLIEDLRTLSLLDAGELTLNYQVVNPVVLLERAALAYGAKTDEQNITLAVEAAENLPSVRVDLERMAQVLGNLLSNAIRYVESGGRIDLLAYAEAGEVVIRVRDNGRGIPPDELPNIFARFYRGDEARQQDGETGLGLAITRSLVEAQGGTITAESQPGEGATFIIRLPVA